jgi:hypothetical protein
MILRYLSIVLGLLLAAGSLAEERTDLISPKSLTQNQVLQFNVVYSGCYSGGKYTVTAKLLDGVKEGCVVRLFDWEVQGCKRKETLERVHDVSVLGQFESLLEFYRDPPRDVICTVTHKVTVTLRDVDGVVTEEEYVDSTCQLHEFKDAFRLYWLTQETRQ